MAAAMATKDVVEAGDQPEMLLVRDGSGALALDKAAERNGRLGTYRPGRHCLIEVVLAVHENTSLLPRRLQGGVLLCQYTK
jgi:hypothetical protein